MDVVGRLAPGVTLAAAAQDLAAVTSRLSALYPAAYPGDAGFSFQAAPLASTVAGNVRQPLLFLLAAVGVLMLIACANVSNLLMARAAVRRREMSIRAALGAGRARVVGQLMAESAVIAGTAGVLGVALASLLVGGFELYGPAGMVPVAGCRYQRLGGGVRHRRLVGREHPVWSDSGADHQRRRERRAQGVGPRHTGGGSRFRESMVALQVAASLVLLVGAGLLIQSFLRVQRADAGFDPKNVLTFDLLLPAAQYGEPARRIALYDAFQSRLQAIPGVVSAGRSIASRSADRRVEATWPWSAGRRSRRGATDGASVPDSAGLPRVAGRAAAARS